MLVSQIAKKGVVLSHAGPRGEALGPGRRQRGREKLWARVFIVVS